MAEKLPSFHILICMIEVWQPQEGDIMTVDTNSLMTLTEVERLEIEESYQKLVGTASVKFPRGTIVRKTVTSENETEVAQDSALQTSVDDAGVIEEVRISSTVATTSMFTIGMRIRIRLGYTQNPAIAALGKTSTRSKTIFNDSGARTEYQNACTFLAFDGYITKVSVDTPIELRCENLASGLRTVTCPKITLKSNESINTLFAEDGPYKLLQGTGLTFFPATKALNLCIGKHELDPEMTVADLLSGWDKFGLCAFVTDDASGNPALAICRSYFYQPGNDSILNIVAQSAESPVIMFDYNVASNGLNLSSTEKKYIAVEAKGVDSEKKSIHMTVLYNPKYDASNPDAIEDKYRVVNETKLSKKAMKAGARPLSKAKDKVDTSLYTKVEYRSLKNPTTRDNLFEEARKYLEAYNTNGVDGNLTLFGDLGLRTGYKVQLQDDRYPGKNGYYLVEEVRTTFGPDGYRQTIRLPYCIKRESQSTTTNE